MMLLKDKIALVTGAARGNGAAIALGLAREGAIVVVTDVDGDCAAERQKEIEAAGGRAFSYALDVSDMAQCDRLKGEVQSALGPIDILVNNAGIRPRHSFDSADRDYWWQKAMAVNVDGVRRMTLAWVDSLSATRGSVINITSIAATNASPMSLAYSTSKAAAQMLSKALAMELAGYGIRVNAIAPGVIETEMSRSSREDPIRRDRLLARIPMARFGRPEELVGAVLFLASDMSTYVTGATINVDGGYLAV